MRMTMQSESEMNQMVDISPGLAREAKHLGLNVENEVHYGRHNLSVSQRKVKV